MKKRPMQVPHMLSEAYHYDNPVPFSRGMRLEHNGLILLLISGTASVNDQGESIHIGDFKAQTLRAFENITELLKSEEMTWQDVVYTRVYLRDIDRDYQEVAKLRMEFLKEQGIEAFPASTCVEAKLCRPELLVEMETFAVKEKE